MSREVFHLALVYWAYAIGAGASVALAGRLWLAPRQGRTLSGWPYGARAGLRRGAHGGRMSVDSIPVAEAAVDQPAADYPDSDTGFVKPAPDSVQTDTVNLSGSTNYVQARLVNVDKGSIGHLRGEAITVTLKNSIIGAATADVFDGVFDQGVIAALTARKAKLSGGQVTLLAAGKVELESGARVLFDLRAGLLAGLLAGGIFSIAYSVWRLLGARRG